MIKIIDYKMGNVLSIYNMLLRIGKKPKICTKPEQLTDAKYIILPGIGNFDDSMIKLKSLGFYHLLNKLVLKKRVNFLGICIGMQLMFNESEEGEEKGFGWIRGKVKRFDFNKKKILIKNKIPHIGWNLVKFKKKNKFFNSNLNEFYFLHSFYVTPVKKTAILATTNYGFNFTSVVQKNNILGVQFHPEKSLNNGLLFMKKTFDGYE